ncbi:uncharacterized protein LOC116296770, partial [Actinia tenebrosa]|uniref:Uncharacterized protein LOC116296770 n=1 Tax=Actinia tenebrosa TaxID=6105 RepID=A0A6P8I7N1_ACTTE
QPWAPSKAFKTPSKNRHPDDWLPRANIKKAFNDPTEFNLETEDDVQTFANKFAVDVKHVKEYFCHLKILKQGAEMRALKNDKVNCIISHVLNSKANTTITRTNDAECLDQDEGMETDDEGDEDEMDSDESDVVLDDLSDNSDNSDEESDLPENDYMFNFILVS